MSKNTELEKTPLYTILCDIESKQTWLLAYNNIQFILPIISMESFNIYISDKMCMAYISQSC